MLLVLFFNENNRELGSRGPTILERFALKSFAARYVETFVMLKLELYAFTFPLLVLFTKMF